MLEAMTPAQWSERQLANELDPLDDTWLQVGTICAVVANKLEEIACRFARKQVRACDYRVPTDYIPDVTKKRPAEVTPEMEEKLRAARWR